MQIPNWKGWIVMGTPLLLWAGGAGFLYLSAWLGERQFHSKLVDFEREMRQRNVPVWITTNGERYHRQSHQVNHPTHPIPHPEAIRRGFTPCQVCNPIPIRKFPTRPELNQSIAGKIQRANWCFGLVILAWIGIACLPRLVKRQLFRPAEGL